MIGSRQDWWPNQLDLEILDRNARVAGDPRGSDLRVELPVRAIAEVYGVDDAEGTFVRDFVDARHSVMTLDRLDLERSRSGRELPPLERPITGEGLIRVEGLRRPMSDVAIVGGGPAGLSAALFTAKNGLDTLVFDTDESWMHKAYLYNYPGIEEIGGTEVLERTRDQAESFDADLRVGEEVTDVERDGDGFTVSTDDEEYNATYVVFATGTETELPERLGCETTENGLVDVGLHMRTTVENAFAVGSMIRDQKWEAVISAGDGGAAALQILSEEEGEPVHDFDTPDE